MIKTICFCDRCGREIEQGERIGYIAMNYRETWDGDLLDGNQYENNHFCPGCMDEIKTFVEGEAIKDVPFVAEPAEETESTETPEENLVRKIFGDAVDNNETAVDNNEAAVDKVTDKVPDGTDPDPDPDPDPEPEKKPRQFIDYGKIMALKKAGWTARQIGEEMHMTQQQVWQATYHAKKKMEAATAEVEE